MTYIISILKRSSSKIGTRSSYWNGILKTVKNIRNESFVQETHLPAESVLDVSAQMKQLNIQRHGDQMTVEAQQIETTHYTNTEIRGRNVLQSPTDCLIHQTVFISWRCTSYNLRNRGKLENLEGWIVILVWIEYWFRSNHENRI